MKHKAEHKKESHKEEHKEHSPAHHMKLAHHHMKEAVKKAKHKKK
jgi:hypothetical protein